MFSGGEPLIRTLWSYDTRSWVASLIGSIRGISMYSLFISRNSQVSWHKSRQDHADWATNDHPVVGMRRSRKVYGAWDIVASQHGLPRRCLLSREPVPESIERNNQRYRPNDNVRGMYANRQVRDVSERCLDIFDAIRQSNSNYICSSRTCANKLISHRIKKEFAYLHLAIYVLFVSFFI